MSGFTKPIEQNKSGLWLGLFGLWVGSLCLRFWGLGRFNALVFDEVYYVKFAHNYLTHTPFFDGHPPLSKYLIAIGIWIGNQLPVGKDTVNSLAGSPLSTWSYRWLNALTGSFIPLVVAAIAYQLSHRRSYALIAGLFAAADGLFLVESRYALNNVYLVIFGLLGQWFFLKALDAPGRKWLLWMALAGLFFGASASIKWNGLWFLLGAYLLWGIALAIRLVRQMRRSATPLPDPFANTPLYRLARLNSFYLLLSLGAVPAIFYRLIWIPHLNLSRDFGFWEVQNQILSYHERVGSGANIHPYCSTWVSWIWMQRPVAYFYQVTSSLTAPIPTRGTASAITSGSVIYDVHAMGNPVLWWFSTGAIALLIWILLENLNALLSPIETLTPRQQIGLLPIQEVWIVLFLVVNYAANLLPWVRVTRCVFLYHYMGSAVFASLALAWLVDRWFRSNTPRLRRLANWTIVLVLVGFVFWMPVYLGLPLMGWQYNLRMWQIAIGNFWLLRWI
ncbi:phospholipid carrier-dependent glycosyltransferase [Phormidesmis priestleyi ULC007]|uniref:Polyprenol-phosphate-mannose--protein mannosyltransferase n=1 Tax=Phormidesmis priestleyi ULC007 TaxID=1920490 RepID=A0A2T1D9B7_9CYAN|nr:phospholipid carrier-dependent glycosyltransferase [Phormidesmis priestleyi]PSB17056.1 phospholipid carrier-dependent glycosyltransferase [Phormidesmis priestleyi ULC007]PZO48150.1 MAG: phospholipid carrier-dependent glycosyltransferase [Phormidesmis priestleyi]